MTAGEASLSVGAAAKRLGASKHALFIDSSILDGADQEELWPPLLDGHADVYLTANVMLESAAYLGERQETHSVESLIVV